MWITSYPVSVRQAAQKERKPWLALTRRLNGPVVLLQDIIEVRHQPVLAAGVQRSFTLELSDRGRVSRMPMVLLPADVTDCMWLYWKIAEGLRHEVNGMFGRQPVLRDFRWRLGGIFSDYLGIPQNFTVAIGFDSDLTRLLRVLRNLAVTPKPKVILLLDEIERLLPTALGKSDFAGFFDFFSYLRGISQENENFVIIVTGANAAITEAPQLEGRDNPVFNFFKEVYLPHLEPAECSKMIRVLLIFGSTCCSGFAFGERNGLGQGSPFIPAA